MALSWANNTQQNFGISITNYNQTIMKERLYVIVSLKHSTKDEVCFWRADNAGYTINPWQAGIYSQTQIDSCPSYYNDGHNTVAICVNNSSLSNSGLHYTVNGSELKKYRKNNRGEIQLVLEANKIN